MRFVAHRALSFLSLLLFLAPPAEAQFVVTPGTANALAACGQSRLYGPASADAPPIIARSFSGEGARTLFRTCKDVEGNTHYFIRKPRPNRNGVCRVYESEVFAASDRDFIIVDTLYDGMAPHWYFTMHGWTATPPANWIALRYSPQSMIIGFVTQGDCPPGDDARYIALDNVTDGLLTSFQGYWQKITRSPQALQAAFAPVPTSSGPGIALDAAPNERLRERLRAAIFERHERFQSLRCDAGGCTAWLQGQSIGFDAGPEGIVLTRLSAVWVA